MLRCSALSTNDNNGPSGHVLGKVPKCILARLLNLVYNEQYGFSVN